MDARLESLLVAPHPSALSVTVDGSVRTILGGTSSAVRRPATH
jgi:hypothetical protein